MCEYLSLIGSENFDESISYILYGILLQLFAVDVLNFDRFVSTVTYRSFNQITVFVLLNLHLNTQTFAPLPTCIRKCTVTHSYTSFSSMQSTLYHLLTSTASDHQHQIDTFSAHLQLKHFTLRFVDPSLVDFQPITHLLHIT